MRIVIGFMEKALIFSSLLISTIVIHCQEHQYYKNLFYIVVEECFYESLLRVIKNTSNVTRRPVYLRSIHFKV